MSGAQDSPTRLVPPPSRPCIAHRAVEFSQESPVSLLVSGSASDSPLKAGGRCLSLFSVLCSHFAPAAVTKFKPLRTLATEAGEDDEDLGPLEVRTSSLAAIARSRAEQRKQQQEEEDRKRCPILCPLRLTILLPSIDRQQEVEEARDLVARAEVTGTSHPSNHLAVD
jgi:hypothetical protein